MKRSDWKWKDHAFAHPGEDGNYLVQRWNPELGRREWWAYAAGWTAGGDALTDDVPVVSWEDTWCDPMDGCGVAPSKPAR